MDQIVRIEQELDGFKDTLVVYREQLGSFLSRNADKISRSMDMPSLMGMERLIKLGDSTTAVSSRDDDFLSGLAQCPANGILEIESKFESVYDIPLGNIQVDVIAMDGGRAPRSRSTKMARDSSKARLASSIAFMSRVTFHRIKSKTCSPLTMA